jgi:putative transcriptional regulator
MFNNGLVFRLFFCTLLLGGWPSWTFADPVEPMPQARESASIFLVASQQLTDPRFRQTVLLLTRHGRAGPIGIIVNRPEAITLDKVFPEHPEAAQHSLFYGGPVLPEQISYLVRGATPVPGALNIANDISLAYDLPALDEFLNGKRNYKNLRVMHGLASWAPVQLEHEIKRGDWIVLPFDETALFDRPPEKLWQELHDRATRYIEI